MELGKRALTWEEVDEIRSYCNHKSCGELSKMYGVTPQTIAKVLLYKRHKLSSRPSHMPPPPIHDAYVSKQSMRRIDIDIRDLPRASLKKTPSDSPLPEIGSWQRIVHSVNDEEINPRLRCPV